MASLVLAFIFIKIFDIIYRKTKGKVIEMVATIRYTDCLQDKRIVFGGFCLS